MTMPLVALLGNLSPSPVEGPAQPAVPPDANASFTNALSSAMNGGPATPVPAAVLPQAMVATMGSRQPARARQGEGAPPRGASEAHAAPVALALRNGTITRDVLMALVGRQEGASRHEQPADGTVAGGLVEAEPSAVPDADWIATAFAADTAGSDGEAATVPSPIVPGESVDPGAVLTGTSPELLSAFVPAIPGQPGALPDGITTLGTSATSSAGMPAPSTASTLNPLFRDRLERVIERMESEFGYKVEVVETVRTQERQDALFRQGRTAPGPVVTWTRNSHHTEGLAADVMVDGTYHNPIAYNRLARIAREEGLRTLGPKDKGHIELPRTALPAGGSLLGALDNGGATHALPTRAEAFARARAMQPSSGMPMMATEPMAAPNGVARVATVASVAQVATVARVADVARVGGGRAPVPPRESSSFVASAMPASQPESQPVVAALDARPTVELTMPAAVTPPGLVRQPRDARPARTIEAAPAIESAEAGDQPRIETRPAVMPSDAGLATSNGHTGDSPRRESSSREREREPVAIAQPNVREALDASLLRAFDGEARPTSFVGRAEGTDSLLGTSAMDRIAELTELRDAAAERPVSSVLLRLDRPDGTEDRIRIGLRGNGVGAAFEMSDSGMAEDLGRHLADLARSMERQGLDPESMTVRTISAKDAPVGAQAAAGERDALRAAAAGSASNGNATGREGRGSSSRQDHPHDESSRQRPRRDSRGDR